MDVPGFFTCECCTLAVVMPAVQAVWGLAAATDDQIVLDRFTAYRAFYIFHDGGFALMQEIDAFHLREHQLVE